MSDNISSIRLAIRAGNKSYFSTSNINPDAVDEELLDLAKAINSIQNTPYDTIIKTVSYRLLSS